MWIDEKRIQFCILIIYFHTLLLGGEAFSSPLADTYAIFEFRLASKPFSPTMCKKLNKESYIRLHIARHRDIHIKMFPGQHIPKETDEARKKDYVYYVTLADLTNGRVQKGAIAFDQRHAIIFQVGETHGVSRLNFLSQFDENQQTIVDLALNTFLRLHPIFNAAVDTCRPYPSRVTYGTDDEIIRIETGKRTFKKLVKQYNENPRPPGPLYYHESGKSQGYVDPEAGKNSNISYQAMNPLNFYVPALYK